MDEIVWFGGQFAVLGGLMPSGSVTWRRVKLISGLRDLAELEPAASSSASCCCEMHEPDSRIMALELSWMSPPRLAEVFAHEQVPRVAQV